MELTEKQRAVVEHGEGPALVYAVAGAGKTTAMKYRIRRLVREGYAAPRQVLAVSFARANVLDLVEGLAPWPECRGVDVRTIHSLSLGILKRARQLGFPVTLGNGDETPDGLDRRLLTRTVAAARAAHAPFADELASLDEEDFLGYVGAAKGNLKYADLATADLPPAALRAARQAEAPAGLDWYLDLFRLYERLRQENAWVTYDDMLVTAWEALLRFPELLQRLQGFYRYLLVDEFQDVNLAQVELLRHIAGQRDNYMAIGDDDQTIYEWRGASPTFIRDFARHHPGTTEYCMDDCFRCPAEPLALANAVIERDKQRRAKRLHLTRGFGGPAELHVYATAAEQAHAIATIVAQEQAAGRALADMAVLVRLTAQTPPLEQALTEQHVPYMVVGGKPFFARDEIRTLLDYCLLAEVEADGEAAPLAEREAKRRAWLAIYNRPKRYVSRSVAEEIWTLAERRGLPLTTAIERVAARPAHEQMNAPLLGLRRVLQWLASNIATMPAHDLLQQLQARLGYLEDLRSRAVKERGEQQAANVIGFIDYARDRGTLAEFRQHLAELEASWAQRRRDSREPVLTISTIHRAKGLEWDVVFVPDCNEGFIPCATADNIAEERRLLYVAFTRARERLFVSRQGRLRQSRFLEQAYPDNVLRRVRRIAQVLSLPPEEWGIDEALVALCADADALGFHSYFRHFWPADAEAKASAAHRIRCLYEASRADRRRQTRVSAAAVAPWREISPDGWQAPVAPVPLPGEVPVGAPRRATRGSEPAPVDGGTVALSPLPQSLQVGDWVRTDAGWARIERIRTGGGEYSDNWHATEAPPVLEVLLRPSHDALAVSLDLGAGRITFDRVRRLYSCSQCRAFASNDPHLISGKHNRVAHGGLRASFRREPTTSLQLTRVACRPSPPDDELE